MASAYAGARAQRALRQPCSRRTAGRSQLLIRLGARLASSAKQGIEPRALLSADSQTAAGPQPPRDRSSAHRRVISRDGPPPQDRGTRGRQAARSRDRPGPEHYAAWDPHGRHLLPARPRRDPRDVRGTLTGSRQPRHLLPLPRPRVRARRIRQDSRLLDRNAVEALPSQSQARRADGDRLVGRARSGSISSRFR
jgi:hypothetical protein